MTNYEDDPSKYIEDQTPIAQAMMRAREVEEAAMRAKAEALEIAAREQRQRDEIARQVELSVTNNPQLQAQRMGIASRVVSSLNIGMIAPPEVVASTPVRFNGIEISGQQARDMVEHGQWDRASYERALAEALGLHGYKAPGSFS